MIHLVIYAVVAAAGLLIGASLMKDVQQRVAAWLRQHGLSKSALMTVVVLLDSVGSGIRASVRITARGRAPEIVRIDRVYSAAQIKDPALRAALERHGHVERDVMQLVTA